MAEVRDIASRRYDDDQKEPSARQQRILEAYFMNPNAAAVGREQRMSERNVRRIVKRFEGQLQERRRQRDEESNARAEARRARLQDWADAAQQDNLAALDELAASTNEGIRLRAIRMRQTVIDALGGSLLMQASSAVDAALAAKEREAARALHEIELSAEDVGSSEDHDV